MKKLITLSIAVLTALTITATTFSKPAEARDRHRDGHIAAGIIIGAVGGAIIASEINRSHRQSHYRDDVYHRRAPAFHGDYYERPRRARHRHYQREIYVQPRVSRWERHVQACYARYRTYDERSDTFIGRDGREYRCNL